MEVVPFPRGPDPDAVRAGIRLAERRTQRLEEQLAKVSTLAGPVREALERNAAALDRIAAAAQDLADVVAASEDILALAANAAQKPPHAFLATVDHDDDPELGAAHRAVRLVDNHPPFVAPLDPAHRPR